MDYDDLLNSEITVFQYQHVDDPEGFVDVDTGFSGLSQSEKNVLHAKVAEAFKKSGWEGDGVIGFAWMPPFFYIPEPDTDPGQVFGTYIWHVKQYNNGTSFIGFYPEGLNFVSKISLLAQQNDGFFYKEP